MIIHRTNLIFYLKYKYAAAVLLQFYLVSVLPTFLTNEHSNYANMAKISLSSQMFGAGKVANTSNIILQNFSTFFNISFNI